MGKDLKELAGDVIKAVFDLSNYLEETEGLEEGIPQDGERIRAVVSEALTDYPQSQIELVLECLVADANMDTAKEAEEAMKEEE